MLFVLAAIIPVSVIGILSYNYVTKLLTTQKHEHLSTASKSYGISIYERLLTAEEQLISVGEDLLYSYYSSDMTAINSIKEISTEMLSDVKIYNKPSDFDGPKLRHLLEGNTDITINHDDLRIRFTRLMNTIGATYLLSAYVNSDYVFGEMDLFIGEYDSCVVAKNKGLLNCSDSAFRKLSLANLENYKNSIGPTTTYSINDIDYIVASWNLNLNSKFNSAAWGIYYIVPSELVYAPINALTNILFPSLFIAILLVSLVSLNQIRKILIPLDKLSSVTRKLARRDFSEKLEFQSNDEFQELGESFNLMSSELDEQFSTMTAMSNLDRAILDTMDKNKIIESVFTNLKKFAEYDNASVITIDKHNSNKALKYDFERESKKLSQRNAIRLSSEDIANLFQDSDYFIKTSEKNSLSKIGWLTNLRTNYVTSVAIKQDIKVIGVILIGHKDLPCVENTKINQLKNYTDRVAVAFHAIQREEELVKQANYDELTGLPNRQLLLKKFNSEIKHATHNNRRIALLFIDLDRFKIINDSQGHAIGDKLLVAVAERIKSCVPNKNLTARYGGDEFAVLIPLSNDTNLAVSVADKIIKRISNLFTIDNYEQMIGASIGISTYPEDGKTWDELIQKADIAMYKAKQFSRGRYLFFSDTMQEEVKDKAELEADLFHALERKEIFLVYQPQLNVNMGEISGAEVLIRWNHPAKGAIHPVRFIEYAEDSGLIVPLGIWVIRESFKQCENWQIDFNKMPKIAINISAKQLRHENFIPEIEELFYKYDIGSTDIEFEITENLFLEDDKNTLEKLKSLNKLGISIAIDDFGKGYSSLSYLKKLPAQTLKIDRLFIKDIDNDKDSATIVKAIIAMAKTLNKNVVAEGVETEEQFKILKDLGCDNIQGYYFSKPRLAEELTNYSSNKIIKLDRIRTDLKKYG